MTGFFMHTSEFHIVKSIGVLNCNVFFKYKFVIINELFKRNKKMEAITMK